MNSNSKNGIKMGSLSWHNIYPIVGSLISVVRYYIFYILKETKEFNIGGFKWEYHPFFFTSVMFCGETMNGFFYLFSCYLSKQASTTDHPSTSPAFKLFKLVPLLKQEKKKKLIQKMVLIILSAYIDGISWCLITFIMSSYDTTKYLSFEMRIFSLFFTAIMSYLFLSYRIFKHQIFAIILVAVGITVFSITDILTNSFDILFAIEYIGLYFIASIREVLQKWLLEVKGIQSVKLIFYEGLIGSITIFICLVILREFFIADSANFFQEDI